VVGTSGSNLDEEPITESLGSNMTKKKDLSRPHGVAYGMGSNDVLVKTGESKESLAGSSDKFIKSQPGPLHPAYKVAFAQLHP
jgi:hypothetical protein